MDIFRLPVATMAGYRAPALSWLRWLVTALGCAGVVCLAFFVRNYFQAEETPAVEAPASEPPQTFILASLPRPKAEEPTWYGLYVPPQFKRASGPFPLLVFFHGRGERKKENFLGAGLAETVRRKVNNGEAFNFVVLCPQSPSGVWEPEENKVAKEMIDLVVEQNNIDAKRIYLTGHSTGGRGLWGLVQTYPANWAAVLSICCYPPNIQKTRSMPCWFFQGDDDHYIPIASARNLVERYRKAGNDVRYTEYKGGGHLIWAEAFGESEVFEWLAKQSIP
jgi:predicted peptidase